MIEFVNQNYHIVTYGCQMNVHESEKISGILETMGMKRCDDIKKSKVIVFNTCCIREGAEDRAFSNISALKKYKQANDDVIIVLCGCMPQQKEGKYDLKKKLPYVDIILGTHNINMLKEYLIKFKQDGKRIYEILEKPVSNAEVITHTVRDDPSNAYVNIIYGCNKFCTYCIVPYVRGRERSRPYHEIEEEFKELVSKGYKYITLLGQNVNSYGKDLNEGLTFSKLLQKLCQIEGDFKIKFMTSHPIDFNKDIVDVMKKEKKMAKCLHLPVQSGSDEILNKMNRRYTSKHYLNLIKMTKKAMPNIALSTDMIVGFPGETDKDFLDTLKLVRKVKYDQMFAFMYSKRTGTPAATFTNQVDEDIKNKRVNKLLREQKFIASRENQKMKGKVFNCLIKVKNGVAIGLTDGGKEIFLPEDVVGNENVFKDVKVLGIREHKLSGKIINN
ncbi:MAG: tRNA (N6-isopentenyl adenosine(37)-C2)-methylthiotransferase MiaB [Clostridia bacterium]|nr:tRNA (N6-isopentenyl adenosine(37)-C2)-methylthiotransferase MiaB [Clostridia bacterium]